MMAARSHDPRLIDRLPTVRGRYREAAPLDRVTWFRVGGPAEVMFRPADADDLATFVREKPADIPITVLGVGSNVLIRDGGVPGVVIRLGAGFNGVAIDGARMTVGAAVLDVHAAAIAAKAGIAGFEFLSGIPGTLGGAIRMNAGAYGSDISEVLIETQVVDGEGRLRRLPAASLGLGYRTSALPLDWIVTQATLEGRLGDPAVVAARIAEIKDAREATQPVRMRTGGSTFANPPGAKAWELIDRAGCRGLRLGGAQVSEHHCNFLINTGDATAADLETLGEEVRRRVLLASGIELRWEIRRLGVAATGPRIREVTS